ncbi:HAD family hydrolase, partial [Paenirhodobacter enshiensis]|uniref:HAD family hydrolase n=1 Tax=Paenirhodobacter enshiensis TaxID=1105367 RepID=UPI003FA1E8D9
MTISALLFDKDGTLFDFSATWSNWAETVLDDLAGGDPALAARLAKRLGFDRDARRYDWRSPVIAGTTREVAEAIAPELATRDIDALAARLDAQSARTPQVPAVALRPCLGALRGRGLKLGLVTNDSEASARVHLQGADVLDLFDYVAGYDSGYGAKPGPGQLREFLAREGLDPAQAGMGGGSPPDMVAGRAGMAPSWARPTLTCLGRAGPHVAGGRWCTPGAGRRHEPRPRGATPTGAGRATAPSPATNPPTART